MIRHRKRLLIRKYSDLMQKKRFVQLLDQRFSPSLSNLPHSPFQTHPQPEQLFQDQSDSEQLEDQTEGDQEFGLLDYIQQLTPSARDAFRKENADLPPIFFMTRKEKKRYFEDQNRKFNKNISTMPQRKSKNKRIVKFKNNFDVKPFSELQKVVAISHAKHFSEGYQEKIHFS